MSTLLIVLVDGKPLAIATAAGLLGALVLGDNFNEALIFGSVAALGSSLGCVALAVSGTEPKIEKYLGNAYVDPVDFLCGALGTGALLAATSRGFDGIAIPSVLAGVSAAVGPMLGTKLIKAMLAKQVMPNK